VIAFFFKMATLGSRACCGAADCCRNVLVCVDMTEKVVFLFYLCLFMLVCVLITTVFMWPEKFCKSSTTCLVHTW